MRFIYFVKKSWSQMQQIGMVMILWPPPFCSFQSATSLQSWPTFSFTEQPALPDDLGCNWWYCSVSSVWPEWYCQACVCLDQLATRNSSHRCSIHGLPSLSVFQGERIEKGQGTWDPSEEPPRDVTSLSWLLFSFLFVPETFYKRNGKKTSMQALQILLLLQCYWFNYYYMYNSIFSHIYSFHWLDFGRRAATPIGL